MEHSSSQVTGNVVSINYKKHEKITPEWIDKLFYMLKGKYGLVWNKFIQQSDMSLSELKIFWYKELKDVSQYSFKLMVSKVKNGKEFQSFVPHLNAISWLCRVDPEALGFPTDNEAFELFAHKQQRKSAPVYHAVQRITDSYSVRLMRTKESKRIFLESYRRVIEEILKGDTTLCEIPEFIALPDKAPEGITQFDDIKGSGSHISTMFSLLGVRK